jgi:hypothetical protein
MTRSDIEATLHRIAKAHVGRDVVADEAIYQEAGLNGMDFYEFMVDVVDALPVPEFQWDEYADMSEPPAGLSLFGRLRILKRKRLTIAHLVQVILDGRWSDPFDD